VVAFVSGLFFPSVLLRLHKRYFFASLELDFRSLLDSSFLEAPPRPPLWLVGPFRGDFNPPPFSGPRFFRFFFPVYEHLASPVPSQRTLFMAAAGLHVGLLFKAVVLIELAFRTVFVGRVVFFALSAFSPPGH